VSLITDALGLRQGRSGKKITRQESHPFRPPAQGKEIGAVGGVFVLIVLGFSVYFLGAKSYSWLEGLVLGVSQKPAPATPALLSSASVSFQSEPISASSSPAPGAAQPQPVPAAAKKDAPSQGEDAMIPETPAIRGTSSTNLRALTVEPRGEEKKPLQVETVQGPEDPGALHPVLVESIQKTKTMDPKLMEKERQNRVENFLLNLRVQGVRIQGTKSRMMVDGSVISVGEVVGDFGLRLKSVESGRLVFVDAEGQEYSKSY